MADLLHSVQFYAENIVQTAREPLLVLDDALGVVAANQGFYLTFQVTPQETEYAVIYELGNGQWDIPPTAEAVRGGHYKGH